ncbi:hypothetical protein SAMN06265182_1411 [Persephonella hydrogeniphila]|uniref:Uncharacterized protein n=1 Tax=Persephonella hydrogeniphila TaxID=198703 RepID=A0A285NM13_9AQUI|nr:hypothetical protein [Persephonella hydrogeniphila]SNZ08896.1 hypothetical protein SAMN06265182_1411 [Persephonella hydrogeniphila]
MVDAVKELDVKFVEIPYRCKCGKEGKEIIVVANNVGVLDTRCEKCGRRIVETKIVENEKVEN